MKLDFNISDVEGRVAFVNDLDLSPADLEMAANYILWGKDPETGLNSVQSKIVLNPSQKTEWNTSKDDTFESLDNLMITPGFNEATLNPITISPTRLKRRVFDRQLTLSTAPPHLYPIFTDLFRKIDELDYQISFWEYQNSKRKSPPRTELTNRFTESELSELAASTSDWTPAQCLRARHKLVELRREQYTYKDTYSSMVTRHSLDWYTPPDTVPLSIQPLNLYNPLTFRAKFNPAEFSESDLKKISVMLWENDPAPYTFDFRDPTHVYNLLLLKESFVDETLDPAPESTAQLLLTTLEYYAAHAELSESQREILDLKLKGQKNQSIADYINQKYQKSYSVNYISTIFCQKIVPRINEAAVRHRELVENLFFEENWKRCSTCGELLLIDAEYFVRKKRSRDGFSSRCKKCDKKERERKKQEVK